MEKENFKQALEKIAPEEAESLEVIYNLARHGLQSDIALTLVGGSDTETEAGVKKKFASITDNLNYIQQFIIEEAANLKEGDKRKREEIIKKYLYLMEDIELQRSYLFKLSFDENVARQQKDTEKLMDEVKKIKAEYSKINPIPEPTEEELKKIWEEIKGQQEGDKED